MRRLVFILTIMTLWGCEQDPIIFQGPFFVRFTENAASAPESELEIIEIPVHYAGPTPESNIEVLYSVGGDAREGVVCLCPCTGLRNRRLQTTPFGLDLTGL